MNIGNPKHLVYADLQYGFWAISLPRDTNGKPISDEASERAVLRQLGLKKRNKGFTLMVDKPDNTVITLLRREAYSKDWVTVARFDRAYS